MPIEIAHDYDPSDYDEADETAYAFEETEPTLSGDLSGYTGCWKLAGEPFYFVINEDYEWIAINLYGEQVGPGYVVDEARTSRSAWRMIPSSSPCGRRPTAL